MLQKTSLAKTIFPLFLSILCLTFYIGNSPALAEEEGRFTKILKFQEEIEGAAAEDSLSSEDKKYNRLTPRSSFIGIVQANEEGNYDLAVNYYNFESLPEDVANIPRETLAFWFHLVTQKKIEGLDFDNISSSLKGDLEDGFNKNIEYVGYIPSEFGKIDVTLERVPLDKHTSIWLVSSETVAAIPRLYKEYGYGRLTEILPRVFFTKRILYIQVWQWMALMILIPLCALAGLMISKVITFVFFRFNNKTLHSFAQSLKGQILLLSAVLLFIWIKKYLGISKFGGKVIASAEELMFSIIILWVILGAVHIIFDLFRRYILQRRQDNMIAMLLPSIRKFTKIFIVCVVLLLYLDNLGIKINTVLAGLGIGGLAFALAGQKTVENLIGGITLYADQPVRIGDFCRFGSIIGTVEDIGLRSTRIRTLDRTLVSVPNTEFVNMHLENFTKRDMIWYHPTIRLRYETTPDQLRYILVEIRKMLYSHPKVNQKEARIRFTNFGEYSLDLKIFSYVKEKGYAAYLEVVEDLNLRIMDIVKDAGSSFAFPSQTAYIERGSRPEPKRAQDISAKVKEWKEKNEMFLPGFPEVEITKLKGTLDYPNPGSPDNPKK